ncbi:hypothetical protein RF11_14414 [Thelohanellus kitauei]|uniref:Uncharacterized protein n=1 Tax=Thelohanellus kitauei TaxID=669202 RepID=A0A0C2J804_THEKT|nr:hypothetical protein RF11_14414 [Thelohanellus kitauei]
MSNNKKSSSIFKSIPLNYVIAAQLVFVCLQIFFNSNLWFAKIQLKQKLINSAENVNCTPMTVGIYVEHSPEKNTLRLLLTLTKKDKYLVILTTAFTYTILAAKFMVLILSMFKRKGKLLLPTCWLQISSITVNLAIMVIYVYMIAPLSSRLTNNCGISATTFVLSWPMAMVAVSLIEITIFLVCHCSQFHLNGFEENDTINTRDDTKVVSKGQNEENGSSAA